MAKDPAFLFYPGDFVAGTMHLDFECTGAYIKLLMLQFQKDRMTLHMIQQVLGHRFEHIWCQIKDKFVEDGGLFWNERLQLEKEKRANFCKSRRDNKNSKKQNQHMLSHMENENENINAIGNVNRFNEDKTAIIFPNGKIQELGKSQKFRAQFGELRPESVKWGEIN